MRYKDDHVSLSLSHPFPILSQRHHDIIHQQRLLIYPTSTLSNPFQEILVFDKHSPCLLFGHSWLLLFLLLRQSTPVDSVVKVKTGGVITPKLQRLKKRIARVLALSTLIGVP